MHSHRPGDRSAPRSARDADDIESLQRVLRRLRNAALVHIIWRDVNGRADVEETTASLTQLADHLIDGALARLHTWAVASDGEPIGRDSGQPQRLVVIGLGKLGAGELNLSSDVDLIFAYAEDGETDTGARTNQQFFTRLGQRLIQVLDAVTADGFVFRVDMRLRPYGDSGALVLSFDATLRYYEEQGRDWERYAWIRARPSAGDLRGGWRLIDQLKPFVFRRYLDFGAVESLREMKGRIDAERSREAMRGNVKLGPGGIREVEFTAQVHQLIWAGRQPTLQCRGVVATLSALAKLKLLSRELSRSTRGRVPVPAQRRTPSAGDPRRADATAAERCARPGAARQRHGLCRLPAVPRRARTTPCEHVARVRSADARAVR